MLVIIMAHVLYSLLYKARQDRKKPDYSPTSLASSGF